MIYLVSNKQELFTDNDIKKISIEDAKKLVAPCKRLQFDTETTGTCPEGNLDTILCYQLGNKKYGFSIVVDATDYPINIFKDELESKFLIGQNLKFDIKFLYNYNIIPTRVYDTMIVEQLLHLGYSNSTIRYGLDSLVEKYLPDQYMSKDIRGQIIWRGLDYEVVKYAAHDVELLEDIMDKQIIECRKKECLVGAKLECDFVPVIAYLEWCGIHLDADKWKDKMSKDLLNLNNAEQKLNEWLIKQPFSKNNYIQISKNGKKYKVPMVSRNNQGDLFSGYDLSLKCNVNWSSPAQAVLIAKLLGFDTKVISKVTNKEANSVLEKNLKAQKGICDEFLDLFFKYKEYSKVTTTYGQGHLNQINPITGNIHTTYWQLGAASGRMSCGSTKPNTTLAKYKGIPAKECTYANIQQLPADEITRSCFTAHKGNLIVSCDWSALESRLGADIYKEKHMIDEYLYSSGDIHSLMAITFFGDQMEQGITTKEVKKKYPELRKAAKSPEFLLQFGGGVIGLSKQLSISEEQAQKYVDNYYNKFKGIADFKKKGSEFVRKYGYVVMNSITGHKMYWQDHKDWLEKKKLFTTEFWDKYRVAKQEYLNALSINKNTAKPKILSLVSKFFKEASKWDRMALNAPTQGTGSTCLKLAAINLFRYIVQNGYFNKIKISALVHDEIVVEFPEELKDTFPKKLEDIMLKAAAEYCKSLPIPAEAAVGKFWIH